MNTQKKIIPSNQILTAVNDLGQVITNRCHKHGGGILLNVVHMMVLNKKT